MNINCEVKLGIKTFDGKKNIRAVISSKDNKSGKWESAYMPCSGLKKIIDKLKTKDDGLYVASVEGFISFYTNKNGYKEFQLVIMKINDFAKLEKKSEEKLVDVKDEDVPF